MAVIKTQRQDLANEVNNLPGLEDVRGFRSYNKGTPLKRKKEILRKKIGGQMAYRKRVER
jgi:hypothetical protein